MKKTDLAWLAGLLEGEGCFQIPHTPQIVVVMTDKDVIERVASLWDGGIYRIEGRLPHYKAVYRTAIHGNRALKLMMDLKPLMGKRRSQKIEEIIAKAMARPGIAKGERQGSSKLTDEQAEEIKRLYVKQDRKNGLNGVQLAKRYGVSQATIWYVLYKRQSNIKEPSCH